jgi:homocitrate synthase NifV
LKNPATYQLINPAEVGQHCRFVIGKHSGSASLTYKMESCGVLISKQEAKLLLPFIRRKTTELKRSLSEQEVLELYYKHLK